MRRNQLLLLLYIFTTACNGQNLPKNKIVSQQKIIKVGKPKIVIPAGANPYASFRCSMKDKAGNLWFGTTGFGIYKYDGKLFTHFDEKDGLPNAAVFSLLEDKNGTIWAGTDKGVFRNIGDGFVPFPLENNIFFATSLHFGDETYKGFRVTKTVYCIMQDRVGNMWFGTEQKGLCRFDGKTFTHFINIDNTWHEVPGGNLKNNDTIPHNMVQYIMEDNMGNIWFSALGKGCSGVFSYDGKTFKNHNTGHIFYMIENREGNIWMATRDNGVCLYKGKTMEQFTKKDGFCDRGANALLEDSKGNIWIGSVGNMETKGGCVIIYNGKNFISFSTEALKNNRVWTMVEDKTGNIWFGTRDQGLYRYDGKTSEDFIERAK
ncbi:MAG: two-component regulator propeller domain-containing protein [Bacteroidota bacterium]